MTAARATVESESKAPITSTTAMIAEALTLPTASSGRKKRGELITLRYNEFSLVYLHAEEHVWAQKPKRILALDLDETLVDPDLCLVLNPPLTHVLAAAQAAGDLIVCVTARTDEEQLTTHSNSALSLLDQVSDKAFSMIFFSNFGSKVPSLKFLSQKFGVDPKNICLLDDLFDNINAVSAAGFTAIPVLFHHNLKHIGFAEEFLKDCLLSNPKYQEYMAQYMATKGELATLKPLTLYELAGRDSMSLLPPALRTQFI